MISTIVPLGRNFPSHFPDRKVQFVKRLNQLPKFAEPPPGDHLILNPVAPYHAKLLPAAQPWQMPHLPKSF